MQNPKEVCCEPRSFDDLSPEVRLAIERVEKIENVSRALGPLGTRSAIL